MILGVCVLVFALCVRVVSVCLSVCCVSVCVFVCVARALSVVGYELGLSR